MIVGLIILVGVIAVIIANELYVMKSKKAPNESASEYFKRIYGSK